MSTATSQEAIWALLFHLRPPDQGSTREQDREWFVYPMDYVRRLRGFNARIPPARIWTAHRYTFVPAGPLPASTG